MDTQGIERVTALIDLMNNNTPLSKREKGRLYKIHCESEKVDFFAPDSVIQAKVKAIEERNIERANSVLSKLWNRSLKKENNNDLALHAALFIEFFKEYLKTGEEPPPASPLRVAILLKKNRDVDLEKRFLASWCRHFGKVKGTGYQKLQARYQNLKC